MNVDLCPNCDGTLYLDPVASRYRWVFKCSYGCGRRFELSDDLKRVTKWL